MNANGKAIWMRGIALLAGMIACLSVQAQSVSPELPLDVASYLGQVAAKSKPTAVALMRYALAYRAHCGRDLDVSSLKLRASDQPGADKAFGKIVWGVFAGDAAAVRAGEGAVQCAL
jgi:hypothetical protein